MSRSVTVRLCLAALLAPGTGGAAQAPADQVRSERAEFARWLQDAPTSPLRALAQVPIGPGITVGPPSADVPLTGIAATRIEEHAGRLALISGGASRPLPRDRALSLGSYQILAAGLPGRATVTVFGNDRKPHPPPAHYGYGSPWRFVTALEPVKAPRAERLLAPDGAEVEATEAGTVLITVQGQRVTLRVFRIPAPGGEESDLEIYFQDQTNSHGTYPAGRFVSLVPDANGRYVLDLNRARNPFCAYNTVFACPAPWRGNRIPAAVEAGERYPADS